MWVLYLGLLSSLMNILKIFLSFGPTLTLWVTLKGQPRGSPQVVTPVVVRDVGAHIYGLKEAKAFQEFSQNITMKLKVLYSLLTLLIMKD